MHEECLCSVEFNATFRKLSVRCRIGSRRELFVDDALIEKLSGKAELRLHQPVAREIAIDHNEPWEGSGCVYHSVFKDGDLFRMYYAAGQLTVTPNGVDAATHGQFCCYAESDDGIHWRKPKLELHEFQGSTANNIVMIRQKVGDAISEPGEPAVFKDENPDAPPDARYKALLPANDCRKITAAADRVQIAGRAALVADERNNVSADDGRSTRRTSRSGMPSRSNIARTGVTSRKVATTRRSGIRRESRDPHRRIEDFIHWTDQHDLRYVDSPRSSSTRTPSSRTIARASAHRLSDSLRRAGDIRTALTMSARGWRSGPDPPLVPCSARSLNCTASGGRRANGADARSPKGSSWRAATG
jgi:hypothetical protein